jgi:spore germination protein YaaH
MTFGGWYNLYGGDWPTTYQDRGYMLAGSSNAEGLIQHYGVNMAALSDAEISSGEANLEFFQTHYRKFYYSGGWWVFDLRHEP